MSGLFNQLAESTLDFNPIDNDSAAGATAAGLVDQDYKLNQVDHFEDNAAVYDTRRGGERDWGEYAVGATKKRKVAKSRARAQEVEIEGDQGTFDFNPKENPYYEDVHQGEYRKYAETETLSKAKKQQLAAGLKGLVEKRSANATREPNVPRQGESVVDFLARIKREDAEAVTATKRANDKDMNDYNWVISGKRNQREAAASRKPGDADELLVDDKDGNANGEGDGIIKSDDQCVVAKVHVKGAAAGDDWFAKRKRKADGEELPADADKKDDDEELTIRIPRSEIEHMQKLTEKLYGKAIGESEYVEEITNKISGIAPSSSSSTLPTGDDEAVLGNDVENLLIDEVDRGDGADVYEYSKEWQRAIDAESRRNLAPNVDWARTLYGRHTGVSCLKIDPYAFLTSQRSIDALSNDNKVHIQVECAMRTMKFNLPREEHVFFSVREWSDKHLGTCDVIYYRYNSYIATYRTKAKQSAPTSMTERLRAAANNNNVQKQNEPETHKRIVILHDMKNGFFVCNHFELVEKVAATVRGQSDENGGSAATVNDNDEHNAAREAARKREQAQRRVDDAEKLQDRHKTSNKSFDFLWSGYCYLERINDFR